MPRPESISCIARINKFHVEQLAYFLERLRSIREGDGRLLDRMNSRVDQLGDSAGRLPRLDG